MAASTSAILGGWCRRTGRPQWNKTTITSRSNRRKALARKPCVRVVRITSEVYQLLSACAAGKGPQDFVFTRDDGKPVFDFRTAWEHACERAGCPDLLFHDLRRTAARNLRRLGVSEGVVMRIGGWRSRNGFERYNIVDEQDLADAARRLDEKRELAAAATDTKTDTAPKTEMVQPRLQ